MTTLEGRSKTAVVIIDVQRDVVAAAHDRDAVVASIGRLLDRARAVRAPVIWVQHSNEELERGSEAWSIVPELSPGEDEPVVEKHYGDAFEDTALEQTLAAHGVGRLVVAGAQTDSCIRSTIHGGFARGYDVTLVADAHTTEDNTSLGAPSPAEVIAHTNLYWAYQDAPGRVAEVELADTVDLGSLAS
ncbi:cysteine hydrolase [Demequina sp. TTPB684]|uniref:cysteine hydrolase family protein n=1 Tax=unclassified Demequina TaxID=2620311 RepID=UPI001CF24561|nr:cysteine hydrolase family protein [Demequina sp. TMPB413]MCB2413118.1 cysteine hydrolase [Demequina sp. TTPB684]UPU89280.1 cysteine hydrolase [Demequina sp. TMPB413]